MNPENCDDRTEPRRWKTGCVRVVVLLLPFSAVLYVLLAGLFVGVALIEDEQAVLMAPVFLPGAIGLELLAQGLENRKRTLVLVGTARCGVSDRLIFFVVYLSQ
jgi:hypothetical protein